MTKHVTASEIAEYIVMMNLEFKEGRAEKTVKLHALENNKKGDSWDCRGVGGRWTRKHGSWRNTLFTPFKVTKGPRTETKMIQWRRTQGIWRGGCRFTIVDRWQEPQNSHRRTGKSWRGYTTVWEQDADEQVVLGDDDHGNTATTTMTWDDDERQTAQHGRSLHATVDRTQSGLAEASRNREVTGGRAWSDPTRASVEDRLASYTTTTRGVSRKDQAHSQNTRGGDGP